MPVERCTILGRRGYRWGKTGQCYTGASGQVKAEREGLARSRGEWDKKITEADFKPPAKVREEAALGLKLRKEFERGGLSSRDAGKQGIGSGVVRAQTLVSGKKVSEETIRAMVRFFGRFARFEEQRGGNEARGFWGDKSNPSNIYISWLLWGGNAGRDWANALFARLERKS